MADPRIPIAARAAEQAREPLSGGELFRVLVKAIFLVAGLVVLFWLLERITGVLLFFTLALVLALPLNAPVVWLERRRVPRVAAALLVLAVLLTILALVGWMIVPRLVREGTVLINALPQIATALADRIAEWVSDYPEIEQQLRLDGQAASQMVPWLLSTLQNLWRYAFALLLFLVLTLLLLGIVGYTLADPRPLLRGYVAALPPHLREPGIRAFIRASDATVGWATSSVTISAMKAVPAFFFLSWIGVPGALVWAVFTFVADLVPRLGFYLMSVPPVLVTLAIDPTKALWVGLFYWGISEILGNFVAPRIQASAMRMHPVFLLFVTLAMVSAFGLLGALIATPVAGFIKAYYEEFYLARRPPDPNLETRVEAMLAREPARI